MLSWLLLAGSELEKESKEENQTLNQVKVPILTNPT
jgi:hypothetical protein